VAVIGLDGWGCRSCRIWVRATWCRGSRRCAQDVGIEPPPSMDGRVRLPAW